MRPTSIIHILLATICLAASSCEDDIRPDEAQATVRVSLKAEKDCADPNGAEIRLNYRAMAGAASVKMEEHAPEHYTAQLPGNSVPADNFIEVSLKDRTYVYTPEKIRFESGKSYEYPLVMTAEGLVFDAGTGITVNDWEVTDVTIEFRTTTLGVSPGFRTGHDGWEGKRSLSETDVSQSQKQLSNN